MPADILARADLRGAAAADADADARAERIGKRPRPSHRVDYGAAGHAERDRSSRLRQRESGAGNADGQNEHRGVHHRRGEPERHRRRQRHPHGQQGADQRNDPDEQNGESPPAHAPIRITTAGAP